MTDLIAIADVLDKAAAVIDRNGWTQGDLYDMAQGEDRPAQDCRVCAIGAINTAVYGDPMYPVRSSQLSTPGEHAVDLMRDHLRLGSMKLAVWNDTPGRTADEVTRAMRETAAGLRKAVAS